MRPTAADFSHSTAQLSVSLSRKWMGIFQFSDSSSVRCLCLLVVVLHDGRVSLLSLPRWLLAIAIRTERGRASVRLLLLSAPPPPFVIRSVHIRTIHLSLLSPVCISRTGVWSEETSHSNKYISHHQCGCGMADLSLSPLHCETEGEM